MHFRNNINTFAYTFNFFATHNAKAEKNKKSLQANALNIATVWPYMTRHNIGQKEERTADRRLAKVAVQCSLGTFLVNQRLILRLNICAKNC